METNIVNKKVSQYDDPYIYQATSKQHLKFNS